MLKRDVGYLIKSINDKLKVKADADLKRYNLTLAQSRVIAFLHSNGDEAAQKEIEVFLGVSHPTVVGIVSRMEQNGHVTTRTDEHDKRNKIVKLTKTAQALRMDLADNISANEQKMLATLPPEDVEQLRELLLAVCKNLE